MLEKQVRIFVGDLHGRIHEAERGGEDQLVPAAGELLDGTFGIRAFADILQEIWGEEKLGFEELGFVIEQNRIPYLGKPECLEFDTQRCTVDYPARANKDKEIIDLGEMIADIALPAGDSWYRAMDNVIFAHDYLDATPTYDLSDFFAQWSLAIP